MTPNLGQGGCQAVEHAVVLAASLASAAELETGFRSYENRRYPRTCRVVLDSRRFSSLAHGRTFAMRFVRKWVFPRLSTGFRERQFRHLTQFDAP